MPELTLSFTVDDIRRIREQDNKRYENLTLEAITEDIHKRAAEGHKLLADLKEQHIKRVGKAF